MKPLFFGDSKTRLYGVLQEPAGAPKDAGVLLCYPGPQEYHMMHWAFRRLSALFSRAGFPVLRFDYSCTGDSSGEAHDALPDAWIKDISTAAAELKDLTGARKLVVLGMRLGAAVAAQAVAKGLKTAHLVLWEPVTSGEHYLRQLEELDAQEALRLLQRVTEPRVELGGYPMTGVQRAALARIRLEQEVPKAAQRVTVFVPPGQEAEARPVHETWERSGVKSVLEVVQDTASVTATADRDAAVLYGAVLQAMTDHVAGALA
jgi:pimeloyl-ACP methyl ester carboxylesterase